MKSGLVPILIVLVVSVTAVPSQIQQGPVNALKKVGDSVTLVCVTSSKNCDNVEWSKMEGAQSGKKVYTNAIGILNDFRDGRYSVSSTGCCSLTIKELEISDSGKFSCVLTVGEPGEREEARQSVLVVISVKESESCRSNVMSNDALTPTDGYIFWTSISVPPKSVEPSNVILSFQNKAADETESTDNEQPQTVNTTLTGIARKKSIIQRVCRASLTPNKEHGLCRTIAILDVCTTRQLIVSYPAESIALSQPAPYYKGDTVRCTADGYPYPEFEWTNMKSGDVVDGDTLVIDGEIGDQYTCTATNTVKDETTYLETTIKVACPACARKSSCGPSCVGAIVGAVVVIIVVTGVALFVCWYVDQCPLFKHLRSITEKKKESREEMDGDSYCALSLNEKPPTDSTATWPIKPPRVSVASQDI